MASSRNTRLALVGGAALAITAVSILGYRHWRSASSSTTATTAATDKAASASAPPAAVVVSAVSPVVVTPSVAAASSPPTVIAAVSVPVVAVAAPVVVAAAKEEEIKTAAAPVAAATIDATAFAAAAAAAARGVVYIMRGVPGSGKSTLAKQLLAAASTSGDGNDGAIFSTDDFFAQSGEYKFNPKLLGEAHQWNQARAVAAMEAKRSPIIIDNTNTQRWEARGYVEAALKNAYEVRVREPDTPWKRNAEELAKRNTHGVEVKGIIGMLSRWDRDFSIEAILTSERPVFQPKVPGKRAPGKSPAVTPTTATVTPPSQALDAAAAPFVPGA